MRRIFNFMVGLMVGSLVGAAVAIMLAPVSGEDLRGQLQERSIRLREDIKAVAEARRAELERELNALRAPSKKE